MFFLKELPARDILDAYGRRFPQMDVPCVAAALELLRSASVLLRRLEAYFATHGLSQTRFLILILIDREPEAGGLTATDLAARLDVSKPVVSNTVQALLHEGLLEAAPHERDLRSRRFRLAPAGKARLDALLPGYYELLQQHMHGQQAAVQHTSCGPETSASTASTSSTKPMPPPVSSTQPPREGCQSQHGARGETAPR